MRGIWIYNTAHKKQVETVFGCVTNGENWLFVQLDDTNLWVDNKKYFLNELPDILGVLQNIVDEKV